MSITRESIVALLEHNDLAVARAVVALTQRQTADEQVSSETRHHNGRGWRPCHARMGTSMAEGVARYGRLTPKQVAYWRQRMRCGNMRIGIYANQLVEVAKEKQKKRQLELDIRAYSSVRG
jgi:hypothetical protein